MRYISAYQAHDISNQKHIADACTVNQCSGNNDGSVAAVLSIKATVLMEHMCVRHHLLCIFEVWECLWVDPAPTILSPYVTPYSLVKNCDVFCVMCEPTRYEFQVSQRLSAERSQSNLVLILFYLGKLPPPYGL